MPKITLRSDLIYLHFAFRPGRLNIRKRRTEIMFLSTFTVRLRVSAEFAFIVSFFLFLVFQEKQNSR